MYPEEETGKYAARIHVLRKAEGRRKSDHGDARRLLGARGTAPGGLRRRTTPAAARFRLSNASSRGECSFFSSRSAIAISSAAGCRNSNNVRAKIRGEEKRGKRSAICLRRTLSYFS